MSFVQRIHNSEGMPVMEREILQIHQLLDGELPIEQEEALFLKLAADEELRAAFRQHLLLNRLLQAPPPPVPAHIQELVLQQIERLRQPFLQRHPWFLAMLSAIGGAGLATALLLLLSSPPNMLDSAYLPLPPSPLEVTLNLPAPSNRIPLANTSSPDQLVLPSPEPNTPFSETSPPLLSAAEPKTLPLLPRKPSEELPAPGAQLSSSLPGHDHPNLLLSLRSLGIWELSLPEVNLPSRPSVGIRNLALGFFTHLAPHHAIGAEVGSEAFPQVFSTRIGTLYRQRPTLLWLGASYRWSADLPSISPEVRATLGATIVGPIGRLWLGASVPLGPTASATFGVEGSLLGYRVDGAWFVTRKLGISYGITLAR